MDSLDIITTCVSSTDKHNELESSELHSLITDGNLGLLDFLDPTTGVPTSVSMNNDDMALYHSQPVAVNNGFANMSPNVTHGGRGPFEEDRGTWLVEQSQKLERQQALQQQKLLELEQVIRYL